LQNIRIVGRCLIIYLVLSVNKQTEYFYNKFSGFYPLVNIFLKRQKKALFQEINGHPYGNLLEIGIGNGSNLPLYKTHKIVGIDTSVKMLEIAKKRAGNEIELFQMNGEALKFKDAYFDYVVLSHVIAVVDNPEKLLEEVQRVLKPKGRVFILNHFTPDNWLKYIDRLFRIISKLFHFKSVFYVTDLTALKNFSQLSEINLGPLSYFKLLTFEKHDQALSFDYNTSAD
jgi:phosphatidylethanolamine/phosphatidyl-N-methylethanolamine N-methyltransferase